MTELTEMGTAMKALLLIVVAALGSALGYISRQWGIGKAIRLSRLLFSILASMFTLFLLWALCIKLGLDYQWTVIVVGLFSWLGTEATVTVIEKAVYKRLGLAHVYIKAGEITDGTNLRSGRVYSLDELQRNGASACEYPGTITDLDKKPTVAATGSGD